jgi:3-oxoacyl-(acyl-carrier-protein) synthase
LEAKRLDPSGQLSLISAREAWADAGFSGADAELSDEPLGVDRGDTGDSGQGVAPQLGDGAADGRGGSESGGSGSSSAHDP